MRQKEVSNKAAGFLHGKICAVRSRRGGPDVYDVIWDHNTTEIDKGYLSHGLSPELFVV